METQTQDAPLDVTVARLRRELAEASIPNPRVLFNLATGIDTLAEELRHAREVKLSNWPAPWPRASFVAGLLGDLPVWLVEDLASEPGFADTPPWHRALPVWVASDCGASFVVQTAAGALLTPVDKSKGRTPGAIAMLTDHINAGDGSPLFGLGPSRLGPLFPDVSSLHHGPMRRAALQMGTALGLPVFEALGACTPGPTLETPAEREMLRRLGAEVSAQALAPPLLAAAHAGLPALCLVCVADDGRSPTELAPLLETARRASAHLDELLIGLTEDLARVIQ